MSSQLMAVDGPMAHTVADLDLAYGIMAGYDPTDPWSMPIPILLQRPEEPLKVAVVPEPSGGTTHPSVADGVRKAADALANQGYAVEEVEPPRLAEATRAWTVLLGTTVQLGLDEMKKLMSPEAFQFLGSWLDKIELKGHQEYVNNFALRADLATEWQLFQTEYPIIVAPILTQPPFELGFDERKENIPDLMEQMRFEVILNLLGLPAVCVPVGVADGLPQVVEVVGGRYREDLCLEAAQHIENAYGMITPIDPKVD
jgi:amidase